MSDLIQRLRGNVGRITPHSLDLEAANEIERLLERDERVTKACQKLAAALSRIDYYCGPPNEFEVSGYDVHCDEDAVVKEVRKLRSELDAANKRVAELHGLIACAVLQLMPGDGRSLLTQALGLGADGEQALRECVRICNAKNRRALEQKGSHNA